MNKKLLYVFIVLIGIGCGDPNTGNSNENVENTTIPVGPSAIGYTVMNIYPHDTSSFTEGLFVHEGILYESTGSGGDDSYISWAGPVDLKTGKPQRKVVL